LSVHACQFNAKGWVFEEKYEEKYDGYRILAYKEGSRATVLSRNETDYTRLSPRSRPTSHGSNRRRWSSMARL
jgi:ATP-dependent DNA ligase